MEKLKRCRRLLCIAVMLLLVLILELVIRGMTGSLSSQQTASRWSEDGTYAQVSAFFTPETNVTESQMLPFSIQLKEALDEAGVEADSANGRNYVCAYSTRSTITLTGNKNSITTTVYGVSDDFFLFHPLKCVSGNTSFAGSGEDANTVILDENAAWQLFGATDVAGMCVEIGDTSYIISGVVKSENGIYAEKSGATEVTVYVPYWILAAQQGDEDNTLTVSNLEVLAKNPVKKFGYDTVENLLKTYLGMEEGNYVLVENSSRYGLLSRLAILKNFGTRSMNTDGIVYPYWENRARAFEDITGVLFVAEILLLVYPVICAALFIRFCWKKKGVAWNWLKEHAIWLFHQIKPALRSIKKASSPKSKKSMKIAKRR